jgi:hypoxanthine phosphoribosyltransferase
MKHTVEVMIPEAEIKARIAELGRQITEHYKDSGSEMVLVGLLRGSFMFMADLCREVQVPHEVDFMTASSYGSGMSTTRDVKILKDLDEDIRGKDVLIVEDIIDSGNTLSKVREILSLREPKSLAICTLLDKPAVVKCRCRWSLSVSLFLTSSWWVTALTTRSVIAICRMSGKWCCWTSNCWVWSGALTRPSRMRGVGRVRRSRHPALLFMVYVLKLEVGNARTVALLQRFAVGGGHFQVAQQTIVNTVRPAVDRRPSARVSADCIIVEWPRLYTCSITFSSHRVSSDAPAAFRPAVSYV